MMRQEWGNRHKRPTTQRATTPSLKEAAARKPNKWWQATWTPSGSPSASAYHSSCQRCHPPCAPKSSNHQKHKPKSENHSNAVMTSTSLQMTSGNAFQTSLVPRWPILRVWGRRDQKQWFYKRRSNNSIRKVVLHRVHRMTMNSAGPQGPRIHSQRRRMVLMQRLMARKSKPLVQLTQLQNCRSSWPTNKKLRSKIKPSPGQVMCL